MDTDVDSLLEEPPHWTQQQHNPEVTSSLGHESNDTCVIGDRSPGFLLDKWLAAQERALAQQGNPADGSAGGKPNGSESVLRWGKRTTGEKIPGLLTPSSDYNRPKTPSFESPESHVDDSSASPSVGWKLQLFKAAMGIRKRREEYDMRRRRSLLTLMKKAVQQGSSSLPTDGWEVAEEQKVSQADPREDRESLPCPNGGEGLRSYKGRWGCNVAPASGSSMKRAGVLASNGTSRRSLQGRQSVLSRVLLLQRKQLLASHRLRVLPAHLRIESLLGEGASGRVWRVRHQGTGQVYALKVIEKGNVSPTSSSCARVYAERHVLTHGGRSRHLVKLHAAFQDDKHLFLLQELLPGPSLFYLLQTRGPLPEAEARRYAAQLALAVHAVHKLGFIHRDIKPENVIIGKHGEVKLIDLGLAARPARSQPPSCTGTHSSSSTSSPVYGREDTREAAPLQLTSSCVSSKEIPVLKAASSSLEKKLTEGPGDSEQRPGPGDHRFGLKVDAAENVCGATGAPAEGSDTLQESFASWRLRQLWEGGARSCVGTLHYMAPEVAGEDKLTRTAQPTYDTLQAMGGLRVAQNVFVPPTGRRYSKKADWWSFGAVLFECIFGHPPFAPMMRGAEGQKDPSSLESLPVESFSMKTRSYATSSENCVPPNSAEKIAQASDTIEVGSSPLSSGLITNPELLAYMLRNWRKYLMIPPPPFVVREPRCGDEAPETSMKGLQGKSTEVSREAVDLLRKLLCEEDSRIGFNSIKSHPWFNSLDWEADLRTRKVSEIRKRSQGLRAWKGGSLVRVRAASSTAMLSRPARRSFMLNSTQGITAGVSGRRRCASTFPGGRETDDSHQATSNKTLQVVSLVGVPAATWPSAGSVSLRTNASTVSEIASDADDQHCIAEGLETSPENAGVEPQRDEGEEKGGQFPLCPWSATTPSAHPHSKWLLDLRYLGFEFDRRRAQAKEAAQRLRALCEKAASDQDGLAAQATEGNKSEKCALAPETCSMAAF